MVSETCQWTCGVFFPQNRDMLNELSSSAELDISFKGCITAGLQAGPLYLECRSHFLLYIYRSMKKKIAKKSKRI